MAGGRGSINTENLGENTNYYLHTGSLFLTLSPNNYGSSEKARLVRVYQDGHLGSGEVSLSGGIRPIVSLLPNTIFSNGEGTYNSPYIVLK